MWPVRVEPAVLSHLRGQGVERERIDRNELTPFLWWTWSQVLKMKVLTCRKPCWKHCWSMLCEVVSMGTSLHTHAHTHTHTHMYTHTHIHTHTHTHTHRWHCPPSTWCADAVVLLHPRDQFGCHHHHRSPPHGGPQDASRCLENIKWAPLTHFRVSLQTCLCTNTYCVFYGPLIWKIKYVVDSLYSVLKHTVQ